MAGDLNEVTLIGRLGKDPEIRSMNSGDRVANLSIATSESWKDKHSGEKKERTEWHNVTVWGPLVTVVENYLSKGDKVMVRGQMRTRKWEKDGIDRYSTEVVLQGFDAKLIMLSTKDKGDSGGRGRDDDQASYGGGSDFSRGERGGGGQDQRGNPRESFSADLDDEIPF